MRLILVLGLLGSPLFAAATTSIFQVNEKTNSDTLSLKLTATTYSQWEADYLYQKPHAKVHILLGTYSDTRFSYGAIPEAYYKNEVNFENSSWQFDYSLGRRKNFNNKLDEIFNVGLLNPYVTHDYLNYVPEGQVGFQAGIGNEVLKFSGAFHVIHLPNQGPLVQAKDGVLMGPTPWIQRAPQNLAYNNELSPIYYMISSDLNPVIQNTGYSLGATFGDVQWKNWQINVVYSDSPINEVILTRTVVTDLDLKTDVTIYPTARFSEKMASDILYRNGPVTYFVSALVDRPRNQLENDRTVQFLEPLQVFGGGIHFTEDDLALGISYARFYGGELIDRDQDGKVSSFNFFPYRTLYREPLSVKASLQAHRFFFDVHWIYDRLQNGSLLSFKTRHSPLKQMNLHLGFDILGVHSPSPTSEDFLNAYSSNDRIIGGLEYVF